MKKIKAIVLLSGGLDSMLAAAILKNQEVEVIGLGFESPFYSADRAKKAAEDLGIELVIKDISREMIDLVKNPPSGYGKRMNPCVDCHALMAKLAGKEVEKREADFVATGEVLDQRPFSQTGKSLKKVSKLAGIEILRPLSAKLLPETEIERSGMVKRHLLFDISGRARSRQEELAGKFGFKDFPSPAGGCLLTDPAYSERLIKLLDNRPEMSVNDALILKSGRVFWFNGVKGDKVLLVIGRHEEDNACLEKLAKKGDYVLKLKEVNGPTSVIRGLEDIKLKEIEVFIPESLKLSEINFGEDKANDDILEISALLTGYYAVKARGGRWGVVIDYL
jgi:tRNA-uridine 2-sulfurtransferase